MGTIILYHICCDIGRVRELLQHLVDEILLYYSLPVVLVNIFPEVITSLPVFTAFQPSPAPLLSGSKESGQAHGRLPRNPGTVSPFLLSGLPHLCFRPL